MRKAKAALVKQIVAHPKFVVGETLFVEDLYSVQEIVVTARPTWRPFATFGGSWMLLGVDSYGNSLSYHLSDMGVPGFNYDDRPCRVHKTREAAVEGVEATQTWLSYTDDGDYCYY